MNNRAARKHCCFRIGINGKSWIKGIRGDSRISVKDLPSTTVHFVRALEQKSHRSILDCFRLENMLDDLPGLQIYAKIEE